MSYQMFGQIFNYKISLKHYNLCITVPHFLLWEAFLLLLPFVPLSYSADYIEGPSEKQFNSNRDFQSDLILQTWLEFRVLNRGLNSLAWAKALDSTDILKNNLLAHLCRGPSLFGYKNICFRRNPLGNGNSLHKP